MEKDPPAPPEKPSRDPSSDREAKLAEALRANLRRRKAAPRPPKPGRDDSA
jgi:hypothetical protein